jgi:hypothetical protein
VEVGVGELESESEVIGEAGAVGDDDEDVVVATMEVEEQIGDGGGGDGIEVAGGLIASMRARARAVKSPGVPLWRATSVGTRTFSSTEHWGSRQWS